MFRTFSIQFCFCHFPVVCYIWKDFLLIWYAIVETFKYDELYAYLIRNFRIYLFTRQTIKQCFTSIFIENNYIDLNVPKKIWKAKIFHKIINYWQKTWLKKYGYLLILMRSLIFLLFSALFPLNSSWIFVVASVDWCFCWFWCYRNRKSIAGNRVQIHRIRRWWSREIIQLNSRLH